MTTRTLLLSSLLAAGLLGCDRTPKAAAAAPVAEKAKPAGEHAAHAHAEGGECSDGAETQQLEYTTYETMTGADGAKYVHVGTPLGEVPEVTVAELNAAPERWAGKQVRVSGDISAMCGHKRAWFAVVNAGDQTGTQLQVKTAPAFLVPEGSVGKRARAFGVVEVIEVPSAEARHQEAEHQLPAEGSASGPVKRVVIRATGADFL